MECNAVECNKRATYNVNCDGLKTQVCEDHMIVHKSHAKNFEIIQELE